MTTQIKARSISRTIWEWLPSSPTIIRVLASFEHACNLVASDGQVVVLVLPKVGDGPLNAVIDGGPGDLAALEQGMYARLERGRLRVGVLETALEGATIWEPCPDWKELRARRDTIKGRLVALRAAALRHAPEASLMTLVPGHPARPGPLDSASAFALAAAREPTDLLRAGWQADVEQLKEGAARLAGLGRGLTPSGDDFLCGVMMWGWLAHPDPTMLCHDLLEVSAPRTTVLSAALLGAAARGECAAAWHALLTTLSGETDIELAEAVQRVLSHGATSGADALAGFLWAGLWPVSQG